MMSNGVLVRRAFVAAALAWCCTAVQAAEIDRPTPVNQRIYSADKVVVATARQVDSTWKSAPTGDQIIVTRVLLEVSETLKGSDQSAVWLEVPGGTLGGVTLRVSDEVVIQEGDRGVFFLNPAKAGIHSAVGKGEGLLRLDPNDTVTGTSIRLDDIRRVASQGR
jgi:hypothetical protein